MSFQSHWCDQDLHLQNADVDIHTSQIPLHQTLHPLSNKEALGNILMNTWSSYAPILEESQLSDAGLATDHLHCVALSQSHSLPEFVPLWWWWWTWPTYTHDHTERSPLCRSDEEKSVLVEDSQASGPLVFHEVGRDALSNLPFQFIWFLPHQSFTFLLPLYVSTSAKTKSPGSSEMALAFLL